MSKRFTVVIISPKNDKNKTLKEGDVIFEPLSLLALARVIEPKGYKVELIDSVIENKLEEKIKNVGNDLICVGISCRTDQILDGKEISEYIKKHYPNVPIVWGGWHPTSFCQQTIEAPYVDIVVKGQGELTFLELVECLSTNNSIANVLGISYKEKGKIVHNPDRPLANIEEFPPIPYHLIQDSRYALNNGTLNYISSTGCPHQCGFCSLSIMYHRRWFPLPPQRVIQEIKDLYEKYKFSQIAFVDDNFFVNEKRVIKICEGLIKEGLKVTWTSSLRIDDAIRCNDSTLKLVKESGCSGLGLGMETASQGMLDKIKKGYSAEYILNVADKLNNNKIPTHINVMVGFPEETEDDLQYTWEVLRTIIKKYKKTPLTFSLYQFKPIPGTYLYNLLLDNGKIQIPKTIEEWQNVSLGGDLKKTWITEMCSPKEAMKIFYFGLGFSSIGNNKNLTSFLKMIARYRFINNLFYFPFEWLLYQIYKRR